MRTFHLNRVSRLLPGSLQRSSGAGALFGFFDSTLDGKTSRAGFERLEPAVTQISNSTNPQGVQDLRNRWDLRAGCRLEVGDTAGWKPALRSANQHDANWGPDEAKPGSLRYSPLGAFCAALVFFAIPIWTSAAPYPIELMVQEARLTNNAREFSRFGQSVDIDGNTLAVGSEGKIDIFRRQAGAWNSVAVISPLEDLYQNDAQVSLSGDTLAVTTRQSFSDRGDEVHVYREHPDAGLNAWNTSDRSTSLGAYYSYSHPLTVQEQSLAAQEGWSLTIRSRMVDDFNGSSPSCYVDFANASDQRLILWFDLDNQKNLTVNLSGLETLTLTTNGTGWALYHTHEVVFDPQTGSADYYFDGQKKNSGPWFPTPITGLNGVRFGNGSTAGKGGMNFNQVKLQTTQTKSVLCSYDAGAAGKPVVAPDPLSQGWTANQSTSYPGVIREPVSADVLSVWQLEAALGVPTLSWRLAVSLDGNWLVLGDGDHGELGGAATVYQRMGDDWVLLQNLAPSLHNPGDRFGDAVVIQGDRMLVGAPGEQNSGRVFVFAYDGTEWKEEAVLQGSDTIDGAYFGAALDISEDRAVIGAPAYGASSSQRTGAAYVFQRQGSTWTEQQKLLPDGVVYYFGSSVAIDGGGILVGQSGSAPGRHYLFTITGNQWSLVNSRNYEGDTRDPVVQDVAMDGTTLVVGVTDIEVDSGPVYIYTTDFGNVTGLTQYIRKQLYYPDAQNSATFDPLYTAFRYKHLLYGKDDGGKIRARFNQISDFYGPGELQAVKDVEQELWKGLAIHPEDPALGNLLLDIYYDRTVADQLAGRGIWDQAEKARFGPTLAPPSPAGGFLIDNEIPLYREVLETNRYVLHTYFSLLTNNLAVPGDPPLGFRIFQGLVPGRELESAKTINTNGQIVSVINQPVLFSGYKDLVLLFQLLRDHGQAAETLGRLLIGRNAAGDRQEAADLINDTERFLLLQGTLLKGMFATLPPPDDPSRLAQAIEGYENNLEALAWLEQILAGNANLLGFADDFMMYVQKFTGQNEFFDSYDALHVRLDPAAGSNPLRFSLQQLTAARDSYSSYRGYEDELAAQFQQSSITYEDRLRDIVGVFPDDPRYSDNPTNNPGSELDQQYRSIELARLQIRHNAQEVENVNTEMNIELAKAQSISNVMVNFAGQQAELTEVIGHWNAAQAGANAFADAFSPEKILTGRIFAFAANAALQSVAERFKAKAEAEKEELAGLEQATITGIESDAAIKTMALRLKTLSVESQEATVLLRQEMNRLVALFREKANLEQKIRDRDTAVATRYFADPVHRLGALNDMVEANLSFNEAQKWIFFLVRALEYKWNTHFANFEYPAGSNRRWSTSSVFKLRNAEELEQMYNAMDAFESQIQLPKDDYFDWFSVREDFFGYKLTNNVGEAAVYADPITGDQVGAVQAFRSRLRLLQDAQQNIVLRFNTVRELPGGTFFRGPRFSASGQLLSKGLFLDKIRWIKINLPGTHTLGRSQISGELRYGGTSFIRNFDPGTFDPEGRDRLLNEMTGYNTRFWFFHAPSGSWRFTDALSSPVTMQLSADPRTPPTVQEIDVFKERSVATSDWMLTIPTRDLSQPVLDINQLNDIELYFYHYAVTRP